MTVGGGLLAPALIGSEPAPLLARLAAEGKTVASLAQTAKAA